MLKVLQMLVFGTGHHSPRLKKMKGASRIVTTFLSRVAQVDVGGIRIAQPVPDEQPRLDKHHRFTTAAEATGYLQAEAWRYLNNIPEGERPAMVAALSDYKMDSFAAINQYLWAQTPDPDPVLEAKIKVLDGAVQYGVLRHDLVLYRGLRDYADRFAVGQIAGFRGFSSCSLLQEVAEYFADAWPPGWVVEILAKKGTPVAFLAGLDAYEAELEILLRRGTMYRVLALQAPLHDSGLPMVTIEVL
jgi:hypothetical protein